MGKTIRKLKGLFNLTKNENIITRKVRSETEKGEQFLFIKRIRNSIRGVIYDTNKKIQNIIINKMELCKNNVVFRFLLLIDMVVNDQLRYKTKSQKRFSISYLICSIKKKARLELNLKFHEDSVRSISKIFKGSNWLEREIWDMFGLRFINHVELKRILTDYGFLGFPLRKDYPVNGFNEVNYNSELENLINYKIVMSQEDRTSENYNAWIVRANTFGASYLDNKYIWDRFDNNSVYLLGNKKNTKYDYLGNNNKRRK